MPAGPPGRIDILYDLSHPKSESNAGIQLVEGKIVSFPLHYLLLNFPGILDS
jgi:hypothetical protein